VKSLKKNIDRWSGGTEMLYAARSLFRLPAAALLAYRNRRKNISAARSSRFDFCLDHTTFVRRDAAINLGGVFNDEASGRMNLIPLRLQLFSNTKTGQVMSFPSFLFVSADKEGVRGIENRLYGSGPEMTRETKDRKGSRYFFGDKLVLKTLAAGSGLDPDKGNWGQLYLMINRHQGPGERSSTTAVLKFSKQAPVGGLFGWPDRTAFVYWMSELMLAKPFARITSPNSMGYVWAPETRTTAQEISALAAGWENFYKGDEQPTNAQELVLKSFTFDTWIRFRVTSLNYMGGG
jgi:hypothetical protein